MSAMKLIGSLRKQEPQAATKLTRTQEAAIRTVRCLLDESPLAEALVSEASVHLPRRGRIWVASFTGPAGGPVWRSTGRTDPQQAFGIGPRWEAHAPAQQVNLGRTLPKPSPRVRRRETRTAQSGPRSQHG